jgi:hypothetical protein
MEKIREVIRHKRPSLSESSITTYSSILKNLFKNVFGDHEFSVNRFEETDKVLHYLRELPCNKRKTVLSALVVVTDNKAYRNLMLEDIKEYNHDIQKQEKTETQKENWVNTHDIKELWEEYKRDSELLYKKKNPTINDLQEIQNFVLLSVLGGIFIPPRRSLDFVNFKIKNIDREKDNYLDKNNLVFNSYKTAKFYGEQKVACPQPLKTILGKWILKNPTDYLFFDSNMNQLSSVKLNQRLNKIFGKKVSVNALRHGFLTDKYASHSEQQKKLENDMRDMGSSTKQEQTYIKLD